MKTWLKASGHLFVSRLIAVSFTALVGFLTLYNSLTSPWLAPQNPKTAMLYAIAIASGISLCLFGLMTSYKDKISKRRLALLLVSYIGGFALALLFI